MANGQQKTNILSNLLQHSQTLPTIESSGSWKETTEETEKRRAWEWEEMWHLTDLKKIRDKHSLSTLFLKIILLVVVVAVAYGVLAGEILGIVGGIFTLVAGGSGGLYYRHKEKRATPKIIWSEEIEGP